MNIDLTSGNFANILIIGVGVTSFSIFLFLPDQIVIFSNFSGYLLSLLIGFCLFPFIRLSRKDFYIKGSDSVIECVESMIEKSGISKDMACLVSRPIYDLFLRESPNASNLTKRIHDLSLQARFIYSLSQLFKIFSILLIIAIFLKLILLYFNFLYSNNILSFWQYKNQFNCFRDIFTIHFFIYFPLTLGSSVLLDS